MSHVFLIFFEKFDVNMNNLDDTPPPAISRAWKGAGGGAVGSGVVGDERWYLGG